MTDYSISMVSKCPDCGTFSSSAEGYECFCHQEHCEHEWASAEVYDFSPEEFVVIRVECKKCCKEELQEYEWKGGK